MPFYIGDYLADTQGLTKSEHGSYMLCIMAYWTKGESLEDKDLREIAGRDYERIKRFFVWVNYRWHHKRIDIELAKAEKQQKNAHDKAMKGVAVRRANGSLPQTEIEDRI